MGVGERGIRRALAGAFILAASGCGHAPPVAESQTARPAEESPADRWDLTHLYAGADAWQADLDHARTELDRLAGCRGQLGKSAKRFKACADLYAAVSKRIARIATWASLLHDQDTRVAESLERRQQAELAGVRLAEASSFFAPEVLAMGPRKVQAFLQAEPSLQAYRHPLDDILRQAPHILDAKGEAVVATLSLTAGAPQATYGILTAADIRWPELEIGGEKVTLNQAAYTRHRAAPDRGDRERVYRAFWGKWKEYERTLGTTLYGQVKSDVAYARVRNHPSARAAALSASNIPEGVYDTLIAEVNAALPTLHRYLKLRARLLGVDPLRYHDIYPPLVTSALRFPIAEGKRLTLEAVRPLGPAYVAAVRRGFDERWMDVYPRPGKQSGAYMNPGAYDVHPYVLMNYNDDYESVTTLAHEWGHAMHSYLASQAQPYFDANYSIFTAEIASTVNEALLLDHILARASRDDRLYYLGMALEGLRLTYFRQAMFAEFERDIHAAVEQGETLTGESLTRRYCELLRRHHGEAQGVLEVDEAYCVEWAYIPHFYANFYVYQYATSMAAAALFAERILSGQAGAVDQYLGLLRAGGSDYPYHLLRQAGIDMATAAPYRALAARMNRIMDEIEALLASG